MTAETSNARGLDVEARQAWYEQQIALAETQWTADFLDMWECGDDVPSKEHYVALWLAERATPPPADAAYDRELIARMLDVCGHPMFTLDAYREQARLLRAADNASASAETVSRPAADAEVRAPDVAMALHWIDRYAGGIDDDCQIDLVAEALGVKLPDGYGLSQQPEARGVVEGWTLASDSQPEPGAKINFAAIVSYGFLGSGDYPYVDALTGRRHMAKNVLAWRPALTGERNG